MRLQCVPNCALKQLRKPLAFVRNGPQRSLHNCTYDAAVIGGGITGLTAAYRLTRDPSCSKVTLYEKLPRIGGWLQSETVSVDGGEIVFEYGPRTLRVTQALDSLPLLDLLDDLHLDDQILLTKKSSPASVNRYVYYPDHLVRIPVPDTNASLISNLTTVLSTLLREPFFETLIWSILSEPFKEPPQSQLRHGDESVAEFLSRRFSPQIANMASTLYHGTLAGDIDRLSSEALQGSVRRMESNKEGIFGSVWRMIKYNTQYISVDTLLASHLLLKEKSASRPKDLARLVEDGSTLTLKNGVGQLADALLGKLNQSDKVDVLTNTEIKSIHQDSKSSNLTVEFGSNESRIHNRVIATNPAPDLAKQLGNVPKETAKIPHNTISSLREHNYAVTVMVINLYYPDPHLLPVRGFGYLIPRSLPYEQNPERALGVIFASESSEGQDSAPGTKLTVMMGGHWWDGWKESDYPDHDTAVAMARSLLKRHLGITDVPTVARTRLQRDAIPQPTVGHTARMRELSKSIKHEFDNRITLAGAWYAMGGTSVVDSIRQAYLATSYGVGTQKLGIDHSSVLERFDYKSWDLEGGIVTAPIPTVKSLKYFIQTEVYPGLRKQQ